MVKDPFEMLYDSVTDLTTELHNLRVAHAETKTLVKIIAAILSLVGATAVTALINSFFGTGT